MYRVLNEYLHLNEVYYPSFHLGSNVSYLVDLGNDKSHYFHQKALYPFQYEEPGVYTLSFTGANSVSRLVQKCTVKVRVYLF